MFYFSDLKLEEITDHERQYSAHILGARPGSVFPQENKVKQASLLNFPPIWGKADDKILRAKTRNKSDQLIFREKKESWVRKANFCSDQGEIGEPGKARVLEKP